jgi:uncharacterized membrane protein
MSGALWALAAGAGFGLFQSFNRQAVRGMNVYVATFVQLAVSALILAMIAVLTEDLKPLFTAPLRAHLYFVAAGFFHFLIGWTFLNASQKKIGAARTSPLIGTNPLFATVIAAVTLRELPSLLELAGVVVIVVGAYLVSSENLDADNVNGKPKSLTSILQASGLGLSAAFFWAVSPIFIRLGLIDLPSPLLGVTIGVTASSVAYGIILLWQRSQWIGVPITGESWTYKLIAGVLVGLSTWMRWIALDLTSVAVVLALSMISAPTVIVLSPLISGKHLERVTTILILGTAMILGGALLLTII